MEVLVQVHAVFCLFIPLITAISYGQIIDLECNIACHVDKQKPCISQQSHFALSNLEVYCQQKSYASVNSSFAHPPPPAY